MTFTLPTTHDDMYRLLATSVVGLAKIRERGEILPEAELTGSGTLVRLNDVAGILTAAHVLEAVREKTIGLMLFCRLDAIGQFKIDIDDADFVYADGWHGGQGPDLAFLRIADRSRVADIEALGGTFYNLTKMDRKPPDGGAGEFCLCGVVGESRNVKQTERGGPITGYVAMFAPVEKLDLNEPINGFTAHLQRDEGIPPPSSYGGVSGGSLWLISRAGVLAPIRILIGVAYFETEPDATGARAILCRSLWESYRVLLPTVATRFLG